MAYESGSQRKNLIIVVAVIAFIAAAVGGALWVRGGDLFKGGGGTGTNRIDAELQNHPQAGELYRTVKANYPDEYQAFVARLSEAARNGGSAAVEAQAFAFTRQLMVNHFAGLAKAPNGRIVEIARQYHLLATTLQRSNVALCAQLATTGFRPGSRPPPEAMAILNRIGTLQLQAARVGETQGGTARTDITPAEGDALVVAIGRRNPEAGRLLSGGNALDLASPAQQCDTAVAIYEAIVAMPAEDAAKVTVSLLRQSFGAAPAPAGGTPSPVAAPVPAATR